MSKKSVLALCASTLLILSCSDESNGSGQNACTPECTTGQHCDNGTCVDDSDKDKTDPDKDKTDPDKDKTDPDPNDPNKTDPDPNDPNKTDPNPNDPNKGNACDSCSTDQICVDGACQPCPNPVCNDICCEEGDVCDLYTHGCMPSDGGVPTCNGEICEDDEVCSENGICKKSCDNGKTACGIDNVCCADGKECFENSYCRVVCSATETMCGEKGSEICCSEGQICENNKCLNPCDGIRCGENQEFCCDTTIQICAFNHCVKPTSANKCTVNDDCDLDSFCDTASGRCIAQSEDTNACIYKPPVGEFKPKLKWHYQDNVVGTPIVINLTDDNHDGKINEEDTPDVVFVNTSKYIVALDGATGSVIAKSSTRVFNQHNDIAAADIDADGTIEVLVPSSQQSDTSKNGLYAMTLDQQADGTYKWSEKHFITAPSLTNGWADVHPTVADVNADGMPEVITTRGVIKGDDWSKYQCTIKLAQSYDWYHYFPAVADLDQDGKMEIIDTDIYDATTTTGEGCKVLLNHADSTQSMTMDGTAAPEAYQYTAVADLIPDDNQFPGELVPEIVRVRSGRVSVWKVYKHEGKWIQRRVWDQAQTSSSGGGNPVIADFDGDGQRDIGVAGRTHYSVFNGQTGKIVWAGKTQDASSERTGSSVFDFEGDGVAEVVYRDETRIRIYSGKGAGVDADKDGYMDAKVLWETPNTSGTVIEYPLIVDVDNDGRTEIVMVSEPETQYGDPNNPSYLGPQWTNLPTGVTVYSDTYDNWVRTRRIWNEHAYHVTNINEDGTVPKNEPANWLNKRLNNYRANTQPASGFNAPNLQPAGLKHSLDNCKDKGVITITANVKNAGSIGISAPVAISFYIKDYEHEGKKYDVYLGTSMTKGALAPDGTLSTEFLWNQKGTITVDGNPVQIDIKGDVKITYSVDDAHGNDSYIAFNECIEDDNTAISDAIEYCPTIVN